MESEVDFRGGPVPLLEFLKGLFLPALVSLPCLATTLLFDWLNVHFDTRAFDNVGFLVAFVGVLLFATWLARRWWTPHRTRAWGVIWGVPATPFLLAALFLLAIFSGQVQLGPR